MNHAQLVFKPLKEANGIQDLSGYSYQQLLKDCPRYVICHEVGTEKEKPHTHIYLETPDCEKTIRNKLLKCLQIPKTTRGKGSAFYGLFYNKYKDPSPAYIVKEGNIFDSRGYTSDQLEHYIMVGQMRFKETFAPSIVGVDTSSTECSSDQHGQSVPQNINEFEKLKRAHHKRPGFQDMTMAEIKRWIKSYYLLQGKCIPREGDNRRYSYCLWALAHGNIREEDIAEADRHEATYMI